MKRRTAPPSPPRRGALRRMPPASLPVLLWLAAGLVQAQPEARTVTISTLLDRDPTRVCAEIVMTEAYRRLGYTMKIEPMPGERALAASNSGQVDGELFRREGIEKDYPNLIRLPVAISVAEFVAFSKRADLAVGTWADLEPFQVGYVRGVKAIEANLTAKTSSSTVTEHETLFKMLEGGRFDVVVAVRSTGRDLIRQLGFTDLRVLEPSLLSIKNYHCLNLKNQALAKPLTEVLVQLEQEGFIAGTVRKVLGN